MDEVKFIEICKKLVAKHQETEVENVYVVWLCKILQNSKAMLSTNSPDGMYFEVTYNGDKDEYYFDAYTRKENIKYLPNTKK